MKLIDLYFDSTSVILASRVKRSGVHLVLSGGSLMSCGMSYPVCFALSDKKMFFLALAAGIHIPSAIVCVFLLSEDWKGFSAHEQRECFWTEHHVGAKLSPFTHTLIHLRAQSAPMVSSLQDLEYIFRHSAQPHHNLQHPCVKSAH